MLELGETLTNAVSAALAGTQKQDLPGDNNWKGAPIRLARMIPSSIVTPK